MRMRPRSPASSAPCRAPRRSFGTRAPSTSAPPRLCLAGGTASCDSSFFLPTPSPRTAHVHPSPSHTHTHAHARPGSHTHREHEHAHTRAHTRAHTHTRTRTNAHTARQHARAHTKTERAPPPRRERGGCMAPSFSEAPSLGVSLPHLRWVWCFFAAPLLGVLFARSLFASLFFLFRFLVLLS